MSLDWKGLSYAYIFSVLANRRFAEGDFHSLHPDSILPYQFLASYVQQYNQFPHPQHLQDRFGLQWQHHPAFQTHPMDELVQKLKLEKARWDTQGLIIELQKAITSDKIKSVNDYLRPIVKYQEGLYTMDAKQPFKLSQYKEVLKYYTSGEQEQRICNYGYPRLDELTGGISQQQFIIFYANTSEGKSTLARAVAGNVAKQGGTVLYFTLEESGRKSVFKTLSTVVHFSPGEVAANKMSVEDHRKIAAYDGVAGDVIFVDMLESKTIAELAKYTHQYKPHLIILDQIPLFTPGGDQKWDVMSQVSRNLKSFCQTSKIPMIALTQATRKSKSAKLDDMAFAYSMAQDGDVVVYLHPDEPGPYYIRKKLTILKNRDRARGQSIELKWDVHGGDIQEEENNEFQSFSDTNTGAF